MGLGKLLMILGGILLVLGAALTFAGKIPFLGKLPGDIHIKKENVEIYIPVMSSLILSAFVSLILWFFGKK